MHVAASVQMAQPSPFLVLHLLAPLLSRMPEVLIRTLPPPPAFPPRPHPYQPYPCCPACLRSSSAAASTMCAGRASRLSSCFVSALRQCR